MSVLIKGMVMPKRGHTVTITIVGSGETYVEYYDCKPHVEETIEYKAVPIPPHRRLIDADALAAHKFAGAEHDISIKDGGACYRRGWNDAIEAIMENAETIIGEE